MIGFVTPEVWTVVLDLYSVPGLKEWIASKVFDVAFDFIKAAVKTKRILPPKISLSITCPQSGETINVSLDGTAADVSSLQLELKTKYADGTKSKKVIKIKPK